MKFRAALQDVASSGAAVERTFAATGVAQASLCLAEVSTLLPVLRTGTLTLLPTSV